MQPGDVPHRIALTDAGIRVMHAADGHEDSDVPVDVVTTRSQAALKMLASEELCPLLPLLPIQGRRCEDSKYQIELTI